MGISFHPDTAADNRSRPTTNYLGTGYGAETPNGLRHNIRRQPGTHQIPGCRIRPLS